MILFICYDYLCWNADNYREIIIIQIWSETDKEWQTDQNALPHEKSPI